MGTRSTGNHKGPRGTVRKHQHRRDWRLPRYYIYTDTSTKQPQKTGRKLALNLRGSNESRQNRQFSESYTSEDSQLQINKRSAVPLAAPFRRDLYSSLYANYLRWPGAFPFSSPGLLPCRYAIASSDLANYNTCNSKCKVQRTGKPQSLNNIGYVRRTIREPALSPPFRYNHHWLRSSSSSSRFPPYSWRVCHLS